jgi:alcohol dehydrogenase (cytochrome c)
MFARTAFLISFAALSLPAQTQQPGAQSFATRCAICHGGDGNGGERGPSILNYAQTHSEADLAALLRKGIPEKGMPPVALAAAEEKELLTFVRALRPPAGGRGQAGPQSRPGSVKLQDGRTLSGVVRNESSFDLQLQTPDGKIHRLTREGDAWREAPLAPKVDWASYNGGFHSNRHSRLEQINASNVRRLALQWMFPIPNVQRVEGTPVVIDGIMYVTAVNQAYALDAATGREIWRFMRARTPGLVQDAAIGLNRGVAVLEDKLFLVMDNARLVALDRANGRLLWESEMADSRQHYGSTVAPLVVGNLVIAGISGGDAGLRGFLDAYDAATGKRAWRFWTIPAPGEKGSETWSGTAMEQGCGATWLTGSYDAELDLLYWPTGNPCPDFNGDQRKGDNLYTNTVLALRPKTGELVWHYQFTPHDLYDYDATEPLVLIDADFQGRPRKLLAQANRNGFFYLLDRTNGEFLRATPFVEKLTWAKSIGKNGRPILTDTSVPTAAGAKICPAIFGATNWMSAAYHPAHKLFYVQTLESCTVFQKNDTPFKLGNASWMGGTFRGAPDEPNRKYIRALDLQTGRTVWEFAQTGPARTYSGVLSTDGGLVFFGEDSGAFVALDAKNGKPLWKSQLNQAWRASPMTYMVGGKQYVAVAAPIGFLVFGLPD